MFPIEVFEPQSSYFRYTQTVNGEEHQNRPVTQILRAFGVRGRQHALNIGPTRTGRQRLFGIHARCLNGIRQVQWTPTADSAITKEHPNRSGHDPHLNAAPSIATALREGAGNADGLPVIEAPA